MIGDYKYRISGEEWMDLPDADTLQVDTTLRYIDFANRTLGGYAALQQGLNFLIQKFPQKRQWRILDLGCGDGKQLKVIQKWAQKKSLDVSLTGLDISADSIERARLSPDLDQVDWICADALDPQLDYRQYDIVAGTLFFHHLSNEQIVTLLRRCNNCEAHVLFNDLHRSRVARILFVIFSYLTLAPKMARHDGAMSVKGAFTKTDLNNLIAKSGFQHGELTWKPAFRYLLTLWNE